jgi:hypothetical protein
MDIAKAKIRLDTVLDELAAAGFSVWGWDDESIQIGQRNGPGAECAPVMWWTIRSPNSRSSLICIPRTAAKSAGTVSRMPRDRFAA